MQHILWAKSQSSTRQTRLSLKHLTISVPLLHTPTAMDLFQGFTCRLSMHPPALAISNIAPIYLGLITTVTTAIHSGRSLNFNAIQALHAFKDRLVTNHHDILETLTPSAHSANSLDITSANVYPKLARIHRTNLTTKPVSSAASPRLYHLSNPFTTPHAPII